MTMTRFTWMGGARATLVAVALILLSCSLGCHRKPSKAFRKAKIAFQTMESLAEDKFYTGEEWDHVLELLERVPEDRRDEVEAAKKLKKTILDGRRRYQKHLRVRAAQKRREEREARRARRLREIEADKRRRARIHFASPKGECPVGLHNDGGGECVFDEGRCGVGFEWVDKKKACVPAN